MRSYVTGFAVSLVLTLAAFGLVIGYTQGALDVPKGLLILSIVVLAALQLGVQLIYFLHLGQESKPRLNLISFLFMLLVLIVIVAGSLWIMANLDYNMMHNPNIEKEIIHDEGY